MAASNLFRKAKELSDRVDQKIFDKKSYAFKYFELPTEKEKTHLVEEMLSWKRLSHPFLVNIINCYNDIKVVQMTEFHHPDTLTTLINKQENFDEDFIIRLFTQLCMAIGHLHASGVCHNRITSDHILCEK